MTDYNPETYGPETLRQRIYSLSRDYVSLQNLVSSSLESLNENWDVPEKVDNHIMLDNYRISSELLGLLKFYNENYVLDDFTMELQSSVEENLGLLERCLSLDLDYLSTLRKEKKY
tara:strand:- start:2183 stop:2530 length:348 start_codon:yes stop_codon:yes gene_type:complete